MNLFHPKKQTLVVLGLSFENLRWVPGLLDRYNVKVIQDLEQLWQTFVNPANPPGVILLGTHLTLVELELIRQFKLNPQTGTIPIVLIGWPKGDAEELLGSALGATTNIIDLPMHSDLQQFKAIEHRIAVNPASRGQYP